MNDFTDMKFRNVDEFIEAQLETKAMIECCLGIAIRDGNIELQKKSKKLLTLFADDCAMLRKMAEFMKKPDGSIDFGLSPDARQFLRDVEGR